MIELNKNRINFSNFPNSETNMILSDPLMNSLAGSSKIEMLWRYEDDAELFQVMAIKRHLDSHVNMRQLEMVLVLPYIPYSRMDRGEGNNIFTLKVFSEAINRMGFSEVIVLEAHSDVSLALIERVREIPSTSIMTQNLLQQLEAKNGEENLYVVYPDAGAFKRYGKHLQYPREIHAVKVRDFDSGKISKVSLSQASVKPGFTAVIMDDLVSKGWTFKFIIDALKEIGVSEVYLVVTHCENAILEGELLNEPLLKGIYVTNSLFNAEKPDVLTIMDVREAFLC